jgi:hypothetical protein
MNNTGSCGPGLSARLLKVNVLYDPVNLPWCCSAEELRPFDDGDLGSSGPTINFGSSPARDSALGATTLQLSKKLEIPQSLIFQMSTSIMILKCIGLL